MRALCFVLLGFLTVYQTASAQIEGTARLPVNPARELEAMRLVPPCAPGVPVTVSGTRFICGQSNATAIPSGVMRGLYTVTETCSSPWAPPGWAATLSCNNVMNVCQNRTANLPSCACPTGSTPSLFFRTQEVAGNTCVSGCGGGNNAERVFQPVYRDVEIYSCVQN